MANVTHCLFIIFVQSNGVRGVCVEIDLIGWLSYDESWWCNVNGMDWMTKWNVAFLLFFFKYLKWQIVWSEMINWMHLLAFERCARCAVASCEEEMCANRTHVPWSYQFMPIIVFLLWFPFPLNGERCFIC